MRHRRYLHISGCLGPDNVLSEALAAPHSDVRACVGGMQDFGTEKITKSQPRIQGARPHKEAGSESASESEFHFACDPTPASHIISALTNCFASTFAIVHATTTSMASRKTLKKRKRDPVARSGVQESKIIKTSKT